jgi:hypothetical protein
MRNFPAVAACGMMKSFERSRRFAIQDAIGRQLVAPAFEISKRKIIGNEIASIRQRRIQDTDYPKT